MIITRKLRLSQLHLNIDRSKLIAIFLFVLAFLFAILAGYFAYVFHQEKLSKNSPDDVDKSTVLNTEPQNQQVITSGSDIAKVYPFILPDGSVVSSNAVNGVNGINSVPHIQQRMTSSLPAIPNYQPRPEGLPMPNLPAIPSSGSGFVMSQNSVQNPISKSPNSDEVQGVFTGDSGSNMAIMSDGKIVKEGDTYQGERIVYIGNDGIQFDNGNSISYGIK